MAEITDAELAQLQLKAKQGDDLSGEFQKLKTQYERDVGGLNTYAQGLLQQIQQRETSTGAPEPDPDDLFVDDPKKLKAQIQTTVQDSMKAVLTPVLSGYYGNQFETQITLARADATMPHFAKWEKEIRAYFQGQPQYALVPGMVQQVYALVKTQHFDELMQEAVQQQRRPSAGADEEEEEEEGEGTPILSPSPVPMPRTVAAPVPVSTATGAPPIVSKKRVRLTEDERFVAETYGLTPDEYHLYRDEDAGPDIYGVRKQLRRA